MRVLMLVGGYYPLSTGGIETFVHHLTRGLRAAGHEVVFACPTGADAPRDAVADGTRVHHFYFPDELTRAEYVLAERPRGYDEFALWFDRLRPDVVHAHYLQRPAVIPFLELARERGARTLLTAHYGAMTCLRASRRRFGTPMLRFGRAECDGEMREARCSACVLEARGVPLPVAWFAAGAEVLTSAVAPTLETRVGAAAALPVVVRRNRALLHRLHATLDWFVVVAEWQRRALLANGLPPDRIARVRHGTEPADPSLAGRRSAPNDGAGPVFGWAGRATPEKGLAELVDAFLGLGEVDASLHIACVAGSPEEVAYRDALMRRTAGNARVRWVAPYGADTAGAFFGKLGVLVVPYAVETGPLTVIEALAHGVPVIGSNLGGIRELVTDGVNGRLVAFRDTAALGAALREALSPQVVSSWAAHATWTRDHREVAADYLELYAAPSAATAPAARVT